MATRIVYFSDVGAGVRYNPAGGDRLIVTLDGTLGSTDTNAVVKNNTGNFSASVAGSVVASSYAFSLTGGSLNQIYVAGSGLVSGYSGIYASGVESYHIENDGVISGYSTGITGYTTGAGGFIINRGSINGYYGIYQGSGTLHVNNAGSISSTTVYAITAGVLDDSVVNSGIIHGGVYLNDGKDTYDAHRGGQVTGLISTGGGDDIIIVGAADERVDGGDGNDRVVNASGSGARMTLIDDDGTGVSLGDTYTNVERLWGSDGGADQLIGNALMNWLRGRGGSDLLSGNAGVDELIGDLGRDTLSGGADNDTFVFGKPSDGADVIVDFGLGNDVLKISASGFGAGLGTGPLAANKFWASSTGLAHDADDRFILRTTDKTVWFDSNGSAAGGAVMVADLNDNASFNQNDILIIA